MMFKGMALAGALAIFATTAGAASLSWTATIDGTQAGTSSTATGTASGTFDDVSNSLSWLVNWSGLVSSVVSAHIHEGAAGSNGPVVVALAPAAPPAITPPLAGSTTLTPTQAGLFLNDGLYINIHTTDFPAGEIRGQILASAPQVVPLPAGLLLIGSALGGLLVARRRQRSA